MIFLADRLPGPLLHLGPGPVATPLAALGPPLGAGLFAAWVIAACGRAMDRTGSHRAIRRADAAAAGLRWAALAWHLFAVLGLGWVPWVRQAVGGDHVLLDELLAAAPPLAAAVFSWWAFSPIERRLRDASMLLRLQNGHPLHPPRSRLGDVVLEVRHQMALAVLPIVAILAWKEGLERAAARFVESRPHAQAVGPPLDWLAAALADPARGPTLLGAAQAAGIFGMMLLAPFAVRRLWDTVPLGPGPLRDRLQAVCRTHGVRVRELLVWRTGGTLATGAMLGFCAPARYILLTDGLLEALPPRQVEAVMAHEIAHIRRRHLLWLVVATLAVGGAAATLGDALLRAAGMADPASPLVMAAQAVALVLAMLLALLAFGFVSRRFEWQADAFAAAHISRELARARGEDPAQARICPDGVEAIAAALRGLMPPSQHDAPAFRHGSVNTRLRRLQQLAGEPAGPLGGPGTLRIDRSAARLKAAAVVGLAACATLAILAG